MDTKDEKFHTFVVNDDVEQLPMDELDPTGVLVKPKWRGTSQDKMDLSLIHI